MREDCGILVIDRQGRLLASNPLAGFLLGRSLPPNMLEGLDPLPATFDRAGYPLEKILENEHEKHGLLKGSELPEPGLWFTSFPLFDEARRVLGSVITFVKPSGGEMDQALKFLGVSHKELLDSLPDGVFMVNTRWQITYFNETAQKITGYTSREVLGKFCWEVFRSDLCHKQCPMRLSMTTGNEMLDCETEIFTKCGEKKLILINTSQVLKSGNKVLGGIQSFHECGHSELMKCHNSVPEAFADIAGVSAQMQELIRQLPIIAVSDSNVLIEGESGTGKELIAKAIHNLSERRRKPFLAVNCSAIPETLLESELFGHERGAFTGAIASKPGRFELARGGTLFLDEIGDLQFHLQVKLLRVLEDRAFERVGGTRKIPLEARIIAATNADLKEGIRHGRFREDLYYRLFTVPIDLAPLRERREDIPILVKFFLERLNKKLKKQVRGVDPKVMKIFHRHPWPGNVRELQHVLEYCFVFVRGSVITERHLPPMYSSGAEIDLNLEGVASPLEALEKKTIIRALEKAGGSKHEAARLLQISRSKLWRKMRIHGITEADFKSEHGKPI
jgi:PAS domain S-box-containing protein